MPKKTQVQEPVVQAQIETDNEVEVETEVIDNDNISADYDTKIKTLSFPDLEAELKKLEKDKAKFDKIINKKRTIILNSMKVRYNEAKRESKKGKKTSTSTRQSGFTIPSVVPEKLYNFLKDAYEEEQFEDEIMKALEKYDIEKDFEDNNELKISRTDVTSYLYSYIRKMGLYTKNTNKEMTVNNDLRSLLEIPMDEKLNFNNFQKYLKNVYNAVKKATDTEATSDSNNSTSDSEVESVKNVKVDVKKKKVLSAKA